MTKCFVGVFAAFLTLLSGIPDAQAHNALTFGVNAARCGGRVMCSANGTRGYSVDGRGVAFKFSKIKRWFQIDVDGRSHLRGQLAEPDGATGSFLVVNDTPKPIKGFALILTDDFNARTPSVHMCAGPKARLCDEFNASGGSGVYRFDAELAGGDWNKCVKGKKAGRMCIGASVSADFTANKLAITWSAKRGGEIPSGAVFRIDFSGWNCNAAVEPLGSPSVVMISVDSNGRQQFEHRRQTIFHAGWRECRFRQRRDEPAGRIGQQRDDLHL